MSLVAGAWFSTGVVATGVGGASGVVGVGFSGVMGGWTGGGGGHSRMSSGPSGLRGETGVGSSEGLLWDKMAACCADSARARASMRAAFFGGGGGGRRDTELTGTGPCGESRTTAPEEGQNRGNGSWRRALGKAEQEWREEGS